MYQVVLVIQCGNSGAHRRTLCRADSTQNPRGMASIAQGLEQCVYKGNLDALRDWGHAKDYVRMQWMLFQQDKAEDFVIATGIQYSVC